MPPKPKAAPVVDELPKLYYTAGTSHVTGRTPAPLAFEPTDDDPRPHAFVSRVLGDHLIEADTDASGRTRYEWASEVAGR